MKKTFLFIALNLLNASINFAHAETAERDAIVQKYTVLVHEAYREAHEDALNLQKEIDAFLVQPNEARLQRAKQAWLVSRESYGRTEAFRFYEGPIDFVDENGEEGPEGRLNAWPLDEAYIDYVQGNPKAGIINNPSVEISASALKDKNQADDEAEVSTGYHAIEFLLWGQDLSLEGPGKRLASDYANTSENQRRRAYLKAVTDLLVEDLEFLVNEWAPEQQNFAVQFVQAPDALSKIMTALATLSGFELAAERMATALDSGDQEDEHSCFSDNTHSDFIYNAQGIQRVFFDTGIYTHLKIKDSDLAERLKQQLQETQNHLADLPHPIDREILSTPEASEARAKMEAAIASLQKQADLFKQAGTVLGIEVSINE